MEGGDVESEVNVIMVYLKKKKKKELEWKDASRFQEQTILLFFFSPVSPDEYTCRWFSHSRDGNIK